MLRKILNLLILGTIVLALPSFQDERRSMDYSDSLQDAGVTLTDLRDGQRQGLMLGNGDLYGIVWEKEGGLYMRITKNDIWDARMDLSKDGGMPKVDIKSGTISGPTGGPASYGNTFPQPRCGAALRLSPLPASGGYTAHLDIERASVTIAANSPASSIRILNDRNVVLIKGPRAVSLEEIKAETLPAAEIGRTGDISWLRMKIPGDIDVKGMDYALAVASKGDLTAVSLVTSFDIQSGDVLERAISLARATIGEKEGTLVARHESGWKQFWSRSGIELGDKVLQRWWYRMLYFAGTVTKPGTSPVNLMPPLATDVTPWHSDYHHNYNSWQAFWPLPATNHTELADPWISYLNDMIPRFRFLAKETYDCEGIFCPISSFLREPDPALSKSINKRQMSMNPWGLTIGSTAMNVQNAWQMHLCSPDPVYLRNKIYPIIREAALFYASFMEKCSRDAWGKVRLGPSYSPEHGEVGIYNCPFDIAYVRYTFDALLQASSELHLDPDLTAKCKKFSALLPDYPTALDESGQTVVVDWEGCKYNEVPVHNITVPAAPVFPCDQVTWFSPEAEKDLFRRTIAVTRHNFNNSNVIFNIAKARLSMPEAFTESKKWFLSRELPNGLFEWQGHQHGTYMAEMTGIAGLIDEFLLQSVGNKIRLFPCWPAGEDARFSGLRAQGGFLVSAEFKAGRVVSATIESTAGRELTLLSPWKTIYVNGKEAPTVADRLITLQTKKGEVLRFREAQ
ncbi:MAG: glycoside hydrolase family 95-like protein [Bacteroidales bacterium]|jgi:hypothetical protein